MKVSISKALKIKNRVIREISELETKIIEYNQVIYSSDSIEVPGFEFNTSELYQLLIEKIEILSKLKTIIHRASEPVRTQIFMLGELKSHINFVSKIPGKNGTVNDRYSSTINNVKSQMGIHDLTDIKKGIQERIDKIQDELDEFNAITKVEIPEL